MNFSISSQQLREILIGLGVQSSNLVDKADDWLKPIMIDSIEYHKLKDREIFTLEKYKKKKHDTGIFLTLVIIIEIFYWFNKIRKQNIELFDIFVGVLGIVLAILFFISLIKDDLQYETAARETKNFIEKWVEKEQAFPANVQRLMGLCHKVEACESVLRQKYARLAWTPREQTIEYILMAKGDPAQLLLNFYSSVESSDLNWSIKNYLNGSPLLYALIDLYSPGSLQAFMKACYARYIEDPFSFNSDLIQKLFDQHILNI